MQQAAQGTIEGQNIKAEHSMQDAVNVAKSPVARGESQVVSGLPGGWLRMLCWALGVALFGWQLVVGCTKATRVCEDNACFVTARKNCDADQDCCCTQVCVLGCCLPKDLQERATVGGCLKDGKEQTQEDGGVAEEGPELLADGAPVPCVNGETRSCYPGLAAWVGVGLCKAGESKCAGGTWGPCEGFQLPREETCDQKDNDCDGATDEEVEGCGCTPEAQQSCGIGPCDGMQTCSAQGVWGRCVPSKEPPAETCNGKDDDCDGLVDEGAGCREVAGGLSQGPSVQIWNRSDKKPLRVLSIGQPQGQVHALAYHPGGKELAVASEGKALRLLNPDTGEVLRTLRAGSAGSRDEITTLAYSSSGGRLASGEDDGHIRIWDPATGREITVIASGTHDRPVNSLAFVLGGTRLLSGGDDGKIFFWTTSGSDRRMELTPGHDNLRQFSVNREGNVAASIGSTRLIIWDLQQRRIKKQYNYTARFSAVAFSPRESNIVLTTTEEGIQRWDLNLTQEKPFDEWAVKWARLNVPRGISFDSEGGVLALLGVSPAGGRRSIFLFDLRTPTQGFVLDGNATAVTAVGVRP